MGPNPPQASLAIFEIPYILKLIAYDIVVLKLLHSLHISERATAPFLPDPAQVLSENTNGLEPALLHVAELLNAEYTSFRFI